MIWAASAVCRTSPSCRPRPERPTVDCSRCERAGQGCAIETALFERISQPSVEEGQRTAALRFGDPRVMALTGALCVALTATVGFTNKSLRASVSQLLGQAYSQTQMTYDLRRLRLKGLIVRVPRTNTYVLTHDGIRARCSTPSSTTDYSAPSSQHTCHPHPHNSVRPKDHRPRRQRLHHRRPARTGRLKTCHNVRSLEP